MRRAVVKMLNYAEFNFDIFGIFDKRIWDSAIQGTSFVKSQRVL